MHEAVLKFCELKTLKSGAGPREVEHEHVDVGLDLLRPDIPERASPREVPAAKSEQI